MRDFNNEPSFQGMVQIYRLVMDGMKYFCKKFDLTISEATVVLALCAHGEVSLKELCEYVDLPKSTASRMVDSLVERKMVDRKVPPENRRTIKLSINKQFYKKLEKVNQGPALQQALSANLSQEEAFDVIGGMVGKDINAIRAEQMKQKQNKGKQKTKK